MSMLRVLLSLDILSASLLGLERQLNYRQPRKLEAITTPVVRMPVSPHIFPPLGLSIAEAARYLAHVRPNHQGQPSAEVRAGSCSLWHCIFQGQRDSVYDVDKAARQCTA
ncbi:uncharacterized protein BDZ83DRAFT_603461 [Colletotrichum acutatum]|uniref:Secreted protein n=1 Tax=Glomerella acutata TaxID=27357 RepID=A0AAD8XMR3_GLOAC|nr:uncharacterized protein BDZ83DRAFT_603461 [Colletotrichum acutatum]KAK1730191.1 hypothetical protein BDZ83DRAFT_603461 [Colletotrichum acutatum]